MTVVVFLGPSLPLDQARRILPDAVFLPPAAQADIASALHRWEPDVIGLVDGTFLNTLAVWHKEILLALAQGTAVYGSSSMGALRAVECEAFGMIGIGKIFHDFVDGRLTDDDEVALVHGGADDGWQPLSESMVNVRATLDSGVSEGAIDAGCRDVVVAAGKSLYFPDRTWPAILERAVGLGLGADEAILVGDFAAAGSVDQKRLDAEELLHTIAALPAELAVRPVPEWTFHHSRPCKGLEGRDRHVHREAGDVSLELIARHVMLHRSGAPDLLSRATSRELVQILAEVLGMEPTEADTSSEADRFRVRRNLLDDADFDTYLVRNDLHPDEFAALMRRVAVGRRMESWLRVRRYRLGLSPLLIDELRLGDEYAAWADRAARQESLLERRGGEPESLDPLDELLRDHIVNTAWRPDCPASQWADEADFGDVHQLHAALARTRAVRTYLAGVADDAALWAAIREAVD